MELHDEVVAELANLQRQLGIDLGIPPHSSPFQPDSSAPKGASAGRALHQSASADHPPPLFSVPAIPAALPLQPSLGHSPLPEPQAHQPRQLRPTSAAAEGVIVTEAAPSATHLDFPQVALMSTATQTSAFMAPQQDALEANLRDQEGNVEGLQLHLVSSMAWAEPQERLSCHQHCQSYQSANCGGCSGSTDGSAAVPGRDHTASDTPSFRAGIFTSSPDKHYNVKKPGFKALTTRHGVWGTQSQVCCVRMPIHLRLAE